MVTKLFFSGFPAAYWYCAAIFNAISTATEPLSA